MNSSGQTALDIASFWNHVESAAFLQQHSTQSPYDQAVNYFSQNPLYRASDLRKKTDWLENAMKKETSKFIAFSHDLKPYLLKLDGKIKFAVFTYPDISSFLAKNPQLVFLGLETWDPHSSAWFAVKIPEGEETVCKEINSEGYFSELFPSSRNILMMAETHAGLFAEAHSVLAWLDRYQFCPTCGSSTKVTEGGYKRVCDSVLCRSHKGQCH